MSSLKTETASCGNIVRSVLLSSLLVAAPTRSALSQFVDLDDVLIADSTDKRLFVAVGEVEGVAFETSLYGTGALPGRDLLRDFENEYRELRSIVKQRHDVVFGGVGPERYDSVLAAFSRRPENLLAFADPPDAEGIVRQYFREQTDSTDFLYVHFLDAGRLGERSGTDWREAHVFLEGGGPATHYLRFDVVRRRIDRVAVNWYE